MSTVLDDSTTQRSACSLVRLPLVLQSPAASPLLQLPAALLDATCLFLPWWERLQLFSQVHRTLPPTRLEWTEYDHVRLSEALLLAFEQRTASALHCAQRVRSVCVDYAMEARLMAGAKSLDLPSPTSGLYACMRALVQPPPAARPFGELRQLVASPSVLRLLQECNGNTMQHLHSLATYEARVLAGEREEQSRLLRGLWSCWPALRRVAVERLEVEISELAALPDIEHIWAEDAYAGRDASLHTVLSPRLRCLGYSFSHLEGDEAVRNILRCLAPTPLQRLNLHASMRSMDAFLSLQSLTSIGYSGHFIRLDSWVSARGAPLLPNLRRCAFRDLSLSKHNGEVSAALDGWLQAYGPQLRQLDLRQVSSTASPMPFLSVMLRSCPLLEKLELNAWTVQGTARADNTLFDAADMQHRLPKLPALRSLSIVCLHMSDAVLHQLLACCPGLLECSFEWMGTLTPALLCAVAQCQQLLYCRIHALQVAAGLDVARGKPSAASSVPPPSSVPAVMFPSLLHADITLEGHHSVDSSDLSATLSLLHGSPKLATLALRVLEPYAHRALLRPLASLPRLETLLLELKEPRPEAEEDELFADAASCVDLLQRCSEPARVTREQHAVNVELSWRTALLEVSAEEELRATHSAGLRLHQEPTLRSGYRADDAFGTYIDMMGRASTRTLAQTSGWRVFKRAQSGGEKDGRTAFFRLLEGERAQIDREKDGLASFFGLLGAD